MTSLRLMRRLRLKAFVRTFTRAGGTRKFQIVVGAVFALAGLFTTAVLVLVFTGLASALHTMYLSRDLDALLAMPLNSGRKDRDT